MPLRPALHIPRRAMPEMKETPPLPVSPKGKAWHSLSAEEVLAQLGSAAAGLSGAEAAKRLTTDVPNELKECKRVSALQPAMPRFSVRFDFVRNDDRIREQRMTVKKRL